MIWGKTNLQKQEKKDEKAAKWFAWYPILLKNGQWCWLRYVKYKFYSWAGISWYEYTLVSPSTK